MNYPFWQIPTIGGSLLIAIIAVVHVYVAHLAVGGGLFLVWTERKARRENDGELLAYVKRHTHFFLLLSMVFGAVTGVGIWFIISLVHPAGTSALIHNFVFAWAIEWTFFFGEIVALLLYYYLFDKLAPRTHMIIGWLYFAFAWLSLFVINGILTFMLTPGAWLETGNFWHGFFNPGFFPSLVFRTAIALILAGLFGLVTAVFSGSGRLRASLVRYCARWLLLPFALLLVGGAWYLHATPEGALGNILQRNPEVVPFSRAFLWGSGLLFLGGLLSLLRLPRGLHRGVVALLVVIGLVWMGGFEYMREIARKPYVIYGHLYSNSVTPQAAAELRKRGFLSAARWVENRAVDAENRRDAGRELLTHQCLICHTLGGYNDLLARTRDFTAFGMTAQLSGQGKINTYMPPFFGNQEEKEALAAYIVAELHGTPPEEEAPVRIRPEEVRIPRPVSGEDEYVLLAWNGIGMRCMTDSDPWFVILPPANTVWVQLIRRGPVPKIVTADVEISYRVQSGHRNPQRHVPFWDHAQQNFGVTLEPPTGLAGAGLSGTMSADEKHGAFVVRGIPVVPYRDDGTFHPYPLVTLEARDSDSGKLLAETRAVAPTSTELGCRNCHAGEWRKSGVAGLGDVTAQNILRAHDRMNRTQLLAEAEAGHPKLCASCHRDDAVGARGDPQLLSLSAAMHGFHANHLPEMGADACRACHPSRADGATRCLRGRHGEAGITCVECHGAIEDHALSLLRHEREAGKTSVQRLMANLEPQQVATAEEIAGRLPWANEPDCLTCHVRFSLEGVDAFNHWTPHGDALYRNRSDCRGLMCAACHGSPHAIYPTVNPYGADRDNLQPLQYQGIAGSIGTEARCEVCHVRPMSAEGHHPRMLRR